CIRSGPACPACSASHHPFLRFTGDNNPTNNSAAVWRVSGRANRLPIRSVTSSNTHRQSAAATLSATADARSSILSTTDDHHAPAAPYTPRTPRSEKCRWSIRGFGAVLHKHHARYRLDLDERRLKRG